MSRIHRWLCLSAGTVLGGVFGYILILLANLTGVRTEEDTATWMAVICAINGAMVTAFGWKYWVALTNDAADLLHDQDPKEKPAADTEK
ncbi:MAG: hypothetical protein EXR98_21110 [Gemmataceae bacterium]|nr:hypothetical protein [Gemmataceae bacterium]